MRFLQYYYALPIAMIMLSVTLVPFFHKANIFTAYQYLERRFDTEDAHVHLAAVPVLAQPVVQRRDFGAGGRDVGDPRAQHHA